MSHAEPTYKAIGTWGMRTTTVKIVSDGDHLRVNRAVDDTPFYYKIGPYPFSGAELSTVKKIKIRIDKEGVYE